LALGFENDSSFCIDSLFSMIRMCNIRLVPAEA